MTLSAREIVHKYCKGKLGTRSSTYAGRGNNSGDLNPQILEMIYSGIAKEHGAAAAKAFVQMVASMETDASASAFLDSLYRLEESSWRFNPQSMPQNEAQVLAGAVTDAAKDNLTGAYLAGTAGMAELFGERENRTPASAITGEFLRRHMEEIDPPELREAVSRRKPHSPFGYGM